MITGPFAEYGHVDMAFLHIKVGAQWTISLSTGVSSSAQNLPTKQYYIVKKIFLYLTLTTSTLLFSPLFCYHATFTSMIYMYFIFLQDSVTFVLEAEVRVIHKCYVDLEMN